MKKQKIVSTGKLLATLLFGVCSLGFGANDIIYVDIQKALKSQHAKVLNPKIELKFGSESGISDKIILSGLVSNKKTNGVNKTAEESCTIAFLSALVTFQKRAQKEGGTKAVNLTGYFKKTPYDSTTKFQCAVGAIMTGVALKGDIAK